MRSSINRRSFMGSAAATGAFSIVPRHVLGGAAYVPPSDKVTLAHIGMGTQGFSELGALLENPRIQIVAVCDPNESSNDYVEWSKNSIRDRLRGYLGKPNWRANDSGCPGGREVGREVVDTYYANQRGVEKFKAVNAYADYRELLDRETDVDAVKVMTPDHHHAPACIATMKKGKHVLVHKPLANRMHEARLVIETARKTGVGTHLLAYGSGSTNAQICERIQQGVIGKLREIHNWTNRPVWPQYTEIPKETPPVPEGFDWDLWLGPALYRPYHPQYTHTVFRGWYDFGGGTMADMGIYSLWPVMTALGMDSPISAEAFPATTCWIVDGVSRSAENDFAFPLSSKAKFEFAAKGDLPEVDLYWYDGGWRPRMPAEIEAANVKIGREGILFVGDEGKILADFRGANARLFTSRGNEPLFPEAEGGRGGRRGRRGGEEFRAPVWQSAVEGREQSPGSFLNAGPISDTVNLWIVALRAKTKVLFDSANMRITNNEDANKYLYREYRAGWEL